MHNTYMNTRHVIKIKKWLQDKRFYLIRLKFDVNNQLSQVQNVLIVWVLFEVTKKVKVLVIMDHSRRMISCSCKIPLLRLGFIMQANSFSHFLIVSCAGVSKVWALIWLFGAVLVRFGWWCFSCSSSHKAACFESEGVTKKQRTAIWNYNMAAKAMQS